MIETRNITFITGAGASVPYGYPSGERLVEDIINSLNPNYVYRIPIKTKNEYNCQYTINYYHQPFLDYSFYTSFNEKIYVEFKKKLETHFPQSIDIFLENNPQFRDIGKFAITNIIYKYESVNNIIYNKEEHWLRYLFGKIFKRKEDFDKYQLSFITFNYDRIIEYYLWDYINNAFELNGFEANDLYKKVNIIHLHGKIGTLKFEATGDSFDFGYPFLKKYDGDSDYIFDSTSFDRYSCSKIYETIYNNYKKIKIIHESIEANDSNFTKAKEIISDSKKLYILGFGYDKRNIERLELNKYIGRIYGSGYGLTNTEKETFISYIRSTSLKGIRNLTEIINKQGESKTLEFLRHYFTI